MQQGVCVARLVITCFMTLDREKGFGHIVTSAKIPVVILVTCMLSASITEFVHVPYLVWQTSQQVITYNHKHLNSMVVTKSTQ